MGGRVNDRVELGRREGRDLISFRAGVLTLEPRLDVVVKLDADLSFDKAYLGQLVSRFSSTPDWVSPLAPAVR